MLNPCIGCWVGAQVSISEKFDRLLGFRRNREVGSYYRVSTRIGVDVAVDFRSQRTVPSENRYNKGNYLRFLWPRRIATHQSAIVQLGFRRTPTNLRDHRFTARQRLIRGLGASCKCNCYEPQNSESLAAH